MATCTQNPGRLSDLADAIKAKELSPTDLVQRYLDRIETVQPIAEPWREVDAKRAMAVASEREAQADRGEILGPLHGIPFGVKDIIDVEGLRTRCNCRALQDCAPSRSDAEVVLALRAAGAIVLGKVHTTEFAFFDPSPARNPHNTDHTPGGSSSGSGAAVASGTVPVALGTQTFASVNRPAAYCGIAAIKPSTKLLSTFGVTPLAPLYDTVGFFGWTVEDALCVFEAIMPAYLSPTKKEIKQTSRRIVTINDPLTADASSEMLRVFHHTVDKLRENGFEVTTQPPPTAFQRIYDLHWSTMVYEIGRIHKNLLELPEDMVGLRLREAIKEGLSIETDRYLDERKELGDIRKQFFERFSEVDGFLGPATPEPASEGLESTGNPKYIAPWTALGGPIVSLPSGSDHNRNLPLGCILTGAPGSDLEMCGLARQVASALDLSP